MAREMRHTYEVLDSLNTADAAKKIGVALRTLQRWILDRRIKFPNLVVRNGRAVRLWSGTEIERVRKYKQENYRKGRGRKAKSKK